MSILDHVGAAAPLDDDREYQCEDELFSADYPGIYEFLARVKISGKNRKPGKMIVYYEPERAQVCLSDNHTRSVAWHAGKGVTEALEGLERRLQAGTVDWRYDKRARTG
ncbi:unnamed protein product [marine sediment metagenome]|uniref:Uncharacterized protein n=1 Tax=marine sediment metagenome TaxID=412755 RepID=X1REW0_9ZZZZ